jgi:CCR4-NOT transcription complex subunit 6
MVNDENHFYQYHISPTYSTFGQVPYTIDAHASAPPMPSNMTEERENRFDTVMPIISKRGLPFSVVNLNMLADAYTLPERYDYCDPKFLDWNHRKNHLFALITNLNSDILCLEEFDLKNSEWLAQSFSNKYQVVLSTEATKRKDCCAILVNKQRFKVECNYVLDINHSSTKDSYAVCTIVVEQSLICDEDEEMDANRLTVVCTHLPGDSSLERLYQAEILLERIKHIQDEDAPSSPVVICGDFNCSPSSTVYKLFAQGTVDSSVQDVECKLFTQKQHIHRFPEGFTSAMKAFHSTEPMFTFRTKKSKKTTDYIWYHGEKLQLVGASEQFHEDIAPLPTEHYPSDHLPLIALFQFKQIKSFIPPSANSLNYQIVLQKLKEELKSRENKIKQL